MSRPHITMDVAAIEHNTRSIVRLCAARGIEVMGVTKGVFGDPNAAEAMVRGGVSSIGDSRLENIARLRAAGIDVPLALLRAPSLSRLAVAVDTVDISFHTELEALERLGGAARVVGRRHDVVVMVDLGDRREGVLPGLLPAFAREAVGLPGIRLMGIGANLTCFTGLEATTDNMSLLVDLADRVERSSGQELTWVSGGSSSALPLVAAGAMPERVNQLRIGEAILLGRETVHHRPWPDTVQDVFVLRAEVVEVKDKPPAPRGPHGDRTFGRAPDPGRADGRRALVALGRVDVDVDGLTPLDDQHRILGATSDFLVVDVTGSAGPVVVGDELSFALDYSALVTAMGSSSVDTRVVNRHLPAVDTR